MSRPKFDKSRSVVLVLENGERMDFGTVKSMSEYVHSIAGEGGLKEPASYYVRWRKLDKPAVVELSDMLAVPPPKNGKKRNSDVELNVIDGDLAHLSERYPNTSAGRGEIPDGEWVRMKSPVRSSLASMFQLQASGEESRKMMAALERFESALRSELGLGRVTSAGK